VFGVVGGGRLDDDLGGGGERPLAEFHPALEAGFDRPLDRVRVGAAGFVEEAASRLAADPPESRGGVAVDTGDERLPSDDGVEGVASGSEVRGGSDAFDVRFGGDD